MKICSKCKEPKADNEFYTYYHSTQKKFRTRNVCYVCVAKQKKEYKQLIKRLKKHPKHNPNMRKCTSCNEYKDLETCFYKTKTAYQIVCKECRKEQDRIKRYKEIATIGGSERYKFNPNEYVDEFQKQQVFMVMELLGWQYDGTTWYKPGIKEKDGTWSILKPTITPKKTYNKKERKLNISNEMIMEYREDGLSYREIGTLYGVSGQAVMYKLREDEKKRNRSRIS